MSDRPHTPKPPTHGRPRQNGHLVPPNRAGDQQDQAYNLSRLRQGRHFSGGDGPLGPGSRWSRERQHQTSAHRCNWCRVWRTTGTYPNVLFHFSLCMGRGCIRRFSRKRPSNCWCFFFLRWMKGGPRGEERGVVAGCFPPSMLFALSSSCERSRIGDGSTRCMHRGRSIGPSSLHTPTRTRAVVV